MPVDSNVGSEGQIPNQLFRINAGRAVEVVDPVREGVTRQQPAGVRCAQSSSEPPSQESGPPHQAIVASAAGDVHRTARDQGREISRPSLPLVIQRARLHLAPAENNEALEKRVGLKPTYFVGSRSTLPIYPRVREVPEAGMAVRSCDFATIGFVCAKASDQSGSDHATVGYRSPK
jgi:hypothetical protein